MRRGQTRYLWRVIGFFPAQYANGKPYTQIKHVQSKPAAHDLAHRWKKGDYNHGYYGNDGYSPAKAYKVTIERSAQITFATDFNVDEEDAPDFFVYYEKSDTES